MIDVEIARAQYEHAVAVLIGKPPAYFSLPPLPLTTPPPPIPVALPSELAGTAARHRRIRTLGRLGERPGRACQNCLLSVGELLAAGGLESGSITTLFQGPSALWASGASAAVTIFDVGRRRALNDQAKAAYDSSVATYRQTVLTAFQQVEDKLAELTSPGARGWSSGDRGGSGGASLSLSNTRYEGGVTNYLEVITAQNAALADEVTAVNILGRRMASAVLLIQALGGGWEKKELPNRPECCGKLIGSSN